MDSRKVWKRIRTMIIFGTLYLGVFFLMEAREAPVHIIHTAFDDRIPFCEYFIVPYVLWYFYVAGTLIYLGLFHKDLSEYDRFVKNMAFGILCFVIVSLIYPNGQDLRPTFSSNNPFRWAVNFLYTIDTPTNILPSLHVFAAVACDMALTRDFRIKKHPSLGWTSHILMILIILSTMFLKQHSIVDVSVGLLCNFIFYPLIYPLEIRQNKHNRKIRKIPEKIS